mmetsp:Transcript_27396/g.64447  ORF Transcript_27396/g.64447 Transcript_27396/m.64447 type:complete len:120 (+) Transcript_27396:2357-2716(+)
MTLSSCLFSLSNSVCSEIQSLFLILFRISSAMARASMKRLSLALRTTRTPSSEEESEDPAWRYLDGPASDSEDEDDPEDEDPEDEDPDPFDEEEEDSDPLSDPLSELSPPQNLDAMAGP